MRFKKIEEQLKSFSDNAEVTCSPLFSIENGEIICANVVYVKDGWKSAALAIPSDAPDDYELSKNLISEGIKIFNKDDRDD